ncbi:MAG: hypothetical protein ABFD07_14245 [Methanobacterium sp.]
MTIDTFLYDLAQDLQDHNFGTWGSDIFLEGLDETSPKGITLTPYTGPNPRDVKSGEDNPHNPLLNVFIRDTDLKTCRKTAFDIYKHWRLLVGVTFGDTYFESIMARGTPQFAGLSKMLFPEYSVNFSLKIRS